MFWPLAISFWALGIGATCSMYVWDGLQKRSDFLHHNDFGGGFIFFTCASFFLWPVMLTALLAKSIATSLYIRQQVKKEYMKAEKVRSERMLKYK